MNTKNDYHFRPTTNGRSCSRHGRTSHNPSSPLAGGWAFHPGGDSTGAAMERGYPRTDPRRRVKGHTQLLHQPSLIVSAAVRWTEWLPLHAAFVLTVQLTETDFKDTVDTNTKALCRKALRN